MKLAVLIPAFNEEDSLASVIRAIPQAISGISSIDVVVIDDGSTDGTAAVARQAGAQVVAHAQNQGVGAAFQSGLRKALELGADLTVNIDADGQFSPLEIPKLIQPILRDEADFVTADRFITDSGQMRKPENMPVIKYWGNKRVSRLISLIAKENFSDVSCGFRAYSRTALLQLNLIGRFTYTQESFLDLATKGLRIASVPVDVKYFPGRKSRVAGNLLLYGWRISGTIFRTFRDHQPIRFFGMLGAVFFVLGMLLNAFVMWHFFSVGSFTPYKSVALGGIYLNSLGIIIWIVGLVADMLDRIRSNQEKILYMLKRQNYDRRTYSGESSAQERKAAEH
jgi:glycosyltransferase involved in cell wall biosynthesis